ncbi:hypothetical protein BDV19DRAFT_217946 [Aspergillus venezuelensis]
MREKKCRFRENLKAVFGPHPHFFLLAVTRTPGIGAYSTHNMQAFQWGDSVWYGHAVSMGPVSRVPTTTALGELLPPASHLKSQSYPQASVIAQGGVRSTGRGLLCRSQHAMRPDDSLFTKVRICVLQLDNRAIRNVASIQFSILRVGALPVLTHFSSYPWDMASDVGKTLLVRGFPRQIQAVDSIMKRCDKPPEYHSSRPVVF